MRLILKMIAKVIAIPVIILLGVAWLIVKCMTAILNFAHGLVWLLLGILAVFAVVYHMWAQLAQIVGWGVVSLVILTAGVAIEVFIEQAGSGLLGFVFRG